MTGSDYPGGREHHRPGHEHREGEYEDRDVPAGGPDDVEPVGEYTDTDVTTGDQLRPHDEGEFTDRDVRDEHRHVAEEGSFVDSELPADAAGAADHGATNPEERNRDA